MRVVMTGATGALGSLAAERLVSTGHDLVTLSRTGTPRWDLREEPPADLPELLGTADVVVHAAADIRLGASWDALAPVNVTATARIAETLGAVSRPPRLVFVSSAFAPPRGEGHNNEYEHTKWAAEEVVRAAGIPVTIVRPSLIIGSRGDGRILRFSGLYQFVRMLSHGLVPAVPGKGATKLDVVPVDVAADLLVSEIESPSGRDVVHAVSGNAAPTIEGLIAELFSQLPPDRTMPKFVSQEAYFRLYRPLIESGFSSGQMALLDKVEVFLPYLEVDHMFGESDLTEDEVASAWRLSVKYWLETEGVKADRGRQIWMKR
jgi:nucleoside-diphosphate-sugar epimerase